MSEMTNMHDPLLRDLVGQKLGDVLAELHLRGWGKAICHLPHDGSNTNNLTGKTYEDHIREAGFTTTVKKNSLAIAVISACRRFTSGAPVVVVEMKTAPTRNATQEGE